MSKFYAVMRAIVAVIFRTLFRVKVQGIENIPKDNAVILCCNHISFTDPIFIGIFCPRQIHFMSKAELFKNKFVGWFLGKLGAFAVNRGTGDTSAMRSAVEIIERGSIMGIFPEGTRNSDGGAPKKAKAGVAMIAAHTKANILPAAIYRDGKLHLFSKTTIRFGNIITFEELGLDAQEGAKKSALRYSSEYIMEKITQLWEKGHNGTYIS